MCPGRGSIYDALHANFCFVAITNTQTSHHVLIHLNCVKDGPVRVMFNSSTKGPEKTHHQDRTGYRFRVPSTHHDHTPDTHFHTSPCMPRSRISVTALAARHRRNCSIECTSHKYSPWTTLVSIRLYKGANSNPPLLKHKGLTLSTNKEKPSCLGTTYQASNIPRHARSQSRSIWPSSTPGSLRA